MKTSSSRMKNKVGAQKGAFIKMKQENMYIYQWLDGLCYVPIIAPFQLLPLSLFGFVWLQSEVLFKRLIALVCLPAWFVIRSVVNRSRITARYAQCI
ncbi:hypothetical protein CKK19_01690 [Enterobacter sp. CCUG 70166]|nr:hypothetical protein [Enterobacter sp. CCUG 70166]